MDASKTKNINQMGLQNLKGTTEEPLMSQK
jgi:hypothetical protein